jgi:pyrroline-5-carboxylate reductase
MEEKFFGIFTAMASNSPAFTYLFIDSLARGAQKLGMNKKLALEIAARAVYGSAKMLIETGEHPHELIDKVSSPGGSTVEGICVLSEEGFEASLVKAVEACVNKDKILNG